MSFFTTRERAELGKSAEITMERKIRDVVRSEFAPRRRPDNDLPGHVDSVMQQRPADNNLGGNVGSLIQQVAESSLQEIDDLIVVLRRRREELLNESARVQRAVIEYAKLSQSTMQSARHHHRKPVAFEQGSGPPAQERVPRRRRFQRGAPRQRKRGPRATQYGRSSWSNRGPR